MQAMSYIKMNFKEFEEVVSFIFLSSYTEYDILQRIKKLKINIERAATKCQSMSVTLQLNVHKLR